MVELQLIYEGEGRLRTSSRVDLMIVNARFGAGEIIEARVGKKRSMKQHRWFFALVNAAYENQSAGRVFDNPERLRKWLLIKAGHCNVKRFDPRAITREVTAWLRATYDDIDFTHDGQWVYAKTARSIAFKEVGAADMAAIADKVVGVIMAEIVPGSTLADWQPFFEEARPKQREAA